MSYITNEEEEQYFRELDMINKEFPNIKFSIAIPYNQLNDIVSLQHTIFIINQPTCYCYKTQVKPKKQVFRITSTKSPITFRIIFKQLMLQNYSLKCNHHFIEGIFPISGHSNMFDFMLGS